MMTPWALAQQNHPHKSTYESGATCAQLSLQGQQNCTIGACQTKPGRKDSGRQLQFRSTPRPTLSPPCLLVVLGPLETLVSLGDEIRHHVSNEFLLVVIECAKVVNGLHALLAQSAF